MIPFGHKGIVPFGLKGIVPLWVFRRLPFRLERRTPGICYIEQDKEPLIVATPSAGGF